MCKLLAPVLMYEKFVGFYTFTRVSECTNLSSILARPLPAPRIQQNPIANYWKEQRPRLQAS